MKTAQEPYKQFMFHFSGRDSIDARNMNEEEFKFILNEFEKGQEDKRREFRYHYRTVEQLVNLWLPELLI